MASILFQWLIGLSLSFHPFYVSLTEINHNKKEKSLEISVRIFTDDLENTLRAYSNKAIDITNPKHDAQVDSILYNYINAHFGMRVNGRAYKPVYVGYEIQSESVWTYLEVPGIESVSKLELHNSLLHDFTKQQVNIINAKANGLEKTRKLDHPETQVSFTW